MSGTNNQASMAAGGGAQSGINGQQSGGSNNNNNNNMATRPGGSISGNSTGGVGTNSSNVAGGNNAGVGGVPPKKPEQNEITTTVLDHLNKTGYTRRDATKRIESSRILTPKSSAANKPEKGAGYNYPTGLNSYYSQSLNPENVNHSGPLTGPKYLPSDTLEPVAKTETGTKPQTSSIQTSKEMQQVYNTHDRPYLALRDWTEKSLDLYKPELRRVLYPVFVHIYLDLISKGYVSQAKSFFEENAVEHATLHYKELQTLLSISLPAHIEENEFTKTFRNNKYVLNVSRTTFDLLVYFLHEIEEAGGSSIIRIINQYIEAKITTARPSRFSTEYVLDPEEGLPGLTLPAESKAGAGGAGGGTTGAADGSAEADSLNPQNQPLKLGKLPLDPDFEKDVEMEINEANKRDPKEGDLLIQEFHKLHTKDADSPFRSALPLPHYKEADIQTEIQAVKDSRHRIRIGTTQSALPSVCMYTFHNTHDDMNNLVFSNDSKLVAAGFSDSFIKLWSLEGKRLKSVLKNDTENSKEYDSDGYFGSNQTQHVQETTDTSMLARRLIGHAGPVYGLSFSPDNRYLLSSSEDKSVRLWSTDTYSALVSYKGHNGPVWDVSFGPFGHYFATASHDQTARLWSCDHIYPLRIFAGHLSDVDTVSFHPNSLYVVTGSSDKTCRLWDINKGNTVRVFTGHTAAVSSTVISPDGRWLASAGEDSAINVWDIGSGRRLKTMRGHGKSSIYSLAFSKEGSVLVSSGADCTVRVWDVRRGTNDLNPEPIATYVDPSLADNGTGAISASKKANAGEGGSSSSAGANGASGSGNSAGKNATSGTEGKYGSVNDFESRKRKEVAVTQDHLAVFNTKKTPVYRVQFTERNLCIAGGAFMG